MWTDYSSCFDCEYQYQYPADHEFYKEQPVVSEGCYNAPQYIDYGHYHCHHQQSSTDECCGNGDQQMAVVPDAPVHPVGVVESNTCSHVKDGPAGQCDQCLVTHANGGNQSIAIEDLVDIVMQTTENINGNLKLKKRELNRDAAARYRMKQKERWTDLQNEKTSLEVKQVELKRKLVELEADVEQMKQKILRSK